MDKQNSAMVQINGGQSSEDKDATDGLFKFTVVAIEDNGSVSFLHVWAKDGQNAFASAAACRTDIEVIAAVPGWHEDGKGIYSAGEGVVDADTSATASWKKERKMEWISIEDQMPRTQQTVLVAYTTHRGKQAVTIGWHTPAKTLESGNFESEIDDEYDEETDTYYMKEQWVDESVESEYHYPISGVTHWMPLPELPSNADVTGLAPGKDDK